MTIQSFKHQLNQVFDDNLHTKMWQNVLDWIIIALIIISSLEVFLSTFNGIAERYGHVLKFIDVFTTIFFTIEVSLRIWAADLLDPKYKGFKGRIRYCLSFYGLIDILSTYPAAVGLAVMMPMSILKIFRVLRLIRIFRYMKSFEILGRAVSSKKKELSLSLAFLSIITVILSFFLFYAEHEAQPELIENGWQSMIWAFAKYLGDPGKFADFPLVTPWGKVISVLVGILGVAIFAVPAGLISSGFLEAIEESKAEEKVMNNIERLHHSFRWQKDNSFTHIYHVPPFRPMETLLVKQYLQRSEIVDAVKTSPYFHLYNLAKAYCEEDEQPDRVVVVSCPHNRPYGCCIDRHSKVTIVSTSGNDEPITSWVAYHIAKIGGFNYVAKEEEMNIDSPESFYTVRDSFANEHYDMFFEDVKRLSSSDDSWVIPMCFCVGPKSREHKVHLCFNKRGTSDYDGPLSTISDSGKFDAFSAELSSEMKSKYGLLVDKNEYYGVDARNLMHRLPCRNAFALRLECYVIYVANDKMDKIVSIASLLKKYFEDGKSIIIPEDMKTRPDDCFDYQCYDEWRYKD